MRKAIINMADTGAMESTLHMLTMIGYDCYRPDESLLQVLRKIGLSNVLSVDDMVKDWGYARPRLDKITREGDMEDCDLFVDTKAHTNYNLIVDRWPNLKDKVLWCCLNGGDPKKRKDGLPWTDPPCPILTNNQWYLDYERAYTFIPYYTRFNERFRLDFRSPPICLVHNVQGWGYGEHLPKLKELGVRFYGGGDGNEKLLSHADAMFRLAAASCLMHVKVGDTVGYAMLEAMASECPFFCTQFYIDECRLHDILIPGETCLTFNVNNLDSLKEQWEDTKGMAKIAKTAKSHLLEMMWRDVYEFEMFMREHFK